MKDLSDVTVAVVDYGKFIFLAEAFVGKARKVLYHSPVDKEFQDINDAAKGDGLFGIERVDEILDPAVLEEVDLWVFPDIGFKGLQLMLREMGKAVWGAMGVNDLELSRTKFLDFLDDIGIPKVKSLKVKGLTNLSNHLRRVEGKWIKLNRYRACVETYHHRDYAHSLQKLDEWAVRFGGLKEEVMFVVQDEIDCDVEIGYDGWSVDGEYPSISFQGYELKNELYLGSLLKYGDLPQEVRVVNEAIAPMLAESGYRNFLATEIRVKDHTPYFIDPTFRMAGLTEDQLPETCTNLAEVIWSGANGRMIEPEYSCEYVAVATLHCCDHVRNQWFTLNIPEKVRRWVKLYHYCMCDDLYHFIPSVPLECDEAGVVIGCGDSIEEAIDDLKDHFEMLKDEPLTCQVEGFAELLKQVNDAEEEGMEFSDQPIPRPEIALN